MRKLLLTSIILVLAMGAMAQQKMTVNLIKSDKTYGEKLNGEDIWKVYNGVFQQKFSTLRSDSAIVHLAKNTFDAYGHVVITQGDTLHVYADKLNYDDNTKIAILTDHVRMVDKDAVLTTNLFNYNTATKYGVYTQGGKLVSKDNVLTSTNGYYDANTRDAYFRYNVVTTSPDALIKTDTMRYNSGSRITYFYGPTHIYGKKDKDTLYTENGTYNTKTEQAFFGKKNRYSQGTKSLKGDSLFYDKLKGYGKAIKNITFQDTEQKMLLKGNLGEYFKAEDKAVITQNPYAILITDKSDSTKTDSVKTKAADVRTTDKALDITGKLIDNGKLNVSQVKVPAGLPNPKADSIAKAIAKTPAVKNAIPLTKEIKDDDVNKAINTAKNINSAWADSMAKAIAKNPVVKNATPLLKAVKPADVNSTINAAKSMTVPATGKTTPPAAKTGKPALTDTGKVSKPVVAFKDTVKKAKTDTMYIGADTLETQVITYKALKELQEKRRLAGIRDTSVKPRKPFVPYTAKTMPKFLSAEMPAPIFPLPDYVNRPLFTVVKDTTQKQTSVNTKAPSPANGKTVANNIKGTSDKKADATPAAKLPADKNKIAADSLKAKLKSDSLNLKPKLTDTSRIRILSAHHNVKIFKSDLQGKADSLFYSSSDSVIRSYIKPMYWSQGAQISGDTINLALKNKKADNMDIYPSAFIVHIEKGDSTFFDQVSGKRMRIYFKDSKISRADVLNNAEVIYFTREKNKVTKLTHSVGGNITVMMKNGEVATAAVRIKPEHKFVNIKQVKEDDKILKGFIWKPNDRPASKEDVINPKKPRPEPKDAVKKGAAGKAPAKGTSAKTPAAKSDSVKTASPSVLKTGALTVPAKNVSKSDSVKTLAPLKRDSSAAKKDTTKQGPVKRP